MTWNNWQEDKFPPKTNGQKCRVPVLSKNTRLNDVANVSDAQHSGFVHKKKPAEQLAIELNNDLLIINLEMPNYSKKIQTSSKYF